MKTAATAGERRALAERRPDLEYLRRELASAVNYPFVSHHRIDIDRLRRLVGRPPDEGGGAGMIAVWRDEAHRAIVEWCEGRVIWYCGKTIAESTRKPANVAEK